MKRVSWLFVGAIVAIVGYANWRDARASRAERFTPNAFERPVVPRTSRADLAQRVREMDARLAATPGDAAAAVLMADALLRQARVQGNAGLPARAEAVLRAVLDETPDHYEAQRMLATVYLSQHRFREALQIGARTAAARPDDAWNYGVRGDAHLELGEYDEAFASFQRMMDTRPSAPAYARASYALELQGNLPAALEAMQMALSATAATDIEAIVWHHAQIGDLLFAMGRLDEAQRHYDTGHHLFAGHPSIEAGLTRVLAARGALQEALDRSLGQFERQPAPDVAARIGDLLVALKRADEAERYFALAESGWRTDTPEPIQLAAFLADHDRSLDDAVSLAEREAASRQDVQTMDTLAWAYFKRGRLEEALEASTRARRTGTRNRIVLYHAAAIHRAAGQHDEARRLVSRALDGHERFDLVVAPLARTLRDELTRGATLARRSN